jgi:hypothetical protein
MSLLVPDGKETTSRKRKVYAHDASHFDSSCSDQFRHNGNATARLDCGKYGFFDGSSIATFRALLVRPKLHNAVSKTDRVPAPGSRNTHAAAPPRRVMNSCRRMSLTLQP